MNRICINCSPLLGNITGIERCIYEYIIRFDALADGEGIDLTVVFPKGTRPNLPQLHHIKRVELPGKGNKIYPFALKKYLTETNSIYFSIHGGLCMYRGAVVCTNDVRTWKHKEFDPLLFRLKCNINVLSSKIFASRIVTISETAAKEIAECIHVPLESIAIISPGWEHMKAIEPDPSIWERITYVGKGTYYYSLSSRAPHKNFRWVAEVAKRNLADTFLVAGKPWRGEETETPDNLHYLGYVTDAENVELMGNCKAFLHPSKYEGFGMTPLEAVACGATICVSNASCLPEVFEDCAHYFDPDDYNVDLDKLISEPVGNSQKLLEKYSWDKSAKAWIALMKESGK